MYGGFLVFFLIPIIFAGVSIVGKMEHDFIEQLKESLVSEAILLQIIAEESISGNSHSAIQERLKQIPLEKGARLTVILENGEVLGDTEKDPVEMDNHSNRPEILTARSHGRGFSTRYSDTLNTNMMYLALLVKNNNGFNGYVRTSVSLSSVEEKLGEIRNIVLFSAVSAFIAALILGLFFARHFALPLSNMTSVAQSMSQGDYDRRLSVNRLDEFGKLAKAYNVMAESLKIRIGTIDSERNKLQTILTGMIEGVIALDLSENIVHINSAAGRILEVSPPECLGKSIWKIASFMELKELLANVFNEKEGLKTKLKLSRQFKDTVIEMQISPIYDINYAPAGSVIVMHDVSELHNLEKIRRDFVANISHELKTPITAIRGLIETIIDDEEITPDNRKNFMERAKEQTKRLTSLVDDILALARLESESFVIEKSRVNMNRIILDAVKSLSPVSEEREIEIATELPDTSVEINGDENAITSAISNLLDNALKYTPPKGKIVVRLKTDGLFGVVEIQDNGVGIEQKHHHRIFERFYRVDKARSRELGGTGLGLAIVKHVAQSHGGKVDLESVPGKGSIFRITLPLATTLA